MTSSSATPDPIALADRDVVRKNALALATMSTALGAIIIGTHIESGRRRWGAAVWQDLIQIPGAPAAWGVFILLAGLLLWVGMWRQQLAWSRCGYRLAFVWFCGLAGIQLYTLSHDPNANPIGLVLWLYVAFILRLRFQHAKRIG